MSKTILSTILAVLICLSISSCKSKKVISDSSVDKVTKEEFFDLLDVSTLDFEYFEARGSAKVNTDDFGMGGSFVLRLQKDKIAWMVIKKFGLEVARIKMENDTVTAINRFEKSYWKVPVKELGRSIQMEFEQSELIQLLAGNPLYKKDEFFEYSQETSSVNFTSKYDEYIAKHIFDLLEKSIIESSYSDQTLRNAQIDYTNFEQLNNNKLAKNRMYKTTLPDYGPSRIELKISSFKIDEEISFPFDLPSHYHKMELE